MTVAGIWLANVVWFYPGFGLAMLQHVSGKVGVLEAVHKVSTWPGGSAPRRERAALWVLTLAYWPWAYRRVIGARS